MGHVQHVFDSPSSFDACTNANVKVVYDREIRRGARMSGAFCLHTQINPGDFICAWNGWQIQDADDVERLTNIYDLTKYALSFPTGRKKELLYSSPRLNEYGRPAPLPERESDVVEPRDVSLAVFLNEPSPDTVALYEASTDTVSVVPKARNSANVCLRTEKQRNGIVCPLMFASRTIRPGEELTWDYGATDYDRRFYEIDEDRGVFQVSDEKYSATEASTNVCRITCDSVEFKNGHPIEPFTPDLFLLNADLLTTEDRRRIEFRSDSYLPDRHTTDESTIDTASVDSSTIPDTGSSADRPTKKRRRRQRRLQRRTITVESMQEDAIASLVRQRRELDLFANDILQRLNAVTPGRIRDPTKLRIIAVLKSIIQPAVYLPYEERTARGYTIIHHFPRTEFVLTKADGEAFILMDDDVIWKDIIKMQHMVFLAIDSIIDALKQPRDSDDIHLKFDPYRYTSIYIRADGSRETIEDWNNAVFRQDHPMAHRVGMRLLNKIAHIQDSVKHYNTWYQLLARFDAEKDKRRKENSRLQNEEDLMWQKGRLFMQLALEMLHNNAYEQVNATSFREICYSGMQALLIKVEERPVDPLSISRALDSCRRHLRELQTQGGEADVVLATDLLGALHEPNMWRCESMLASLFSAARP